MTAKEIDLTETDSPTRPITSAFYRWKANGGMYTREALDRVHQVRLADRLTADRSDGRWRIRPSNMARDCARYHALSYFGFEQDEFDDGYTERGTAAHYYWQEVGLSAGFLTDVEVAVEYAPWRLSGSMDGIRTNGTPFELKTVGPWKWSGGRGTPGMKEMADPPAAYLGQIHGYMKALDVREASLVVMCSDNYSQFREWLVRFDDDLFARIDTFMHGVVGTVTKTQLPPMITDCRVATAQVIPMDVTQRMLTDYAKTFNGCSYRSVCSTADDVLAQLEVQWEMQRDEEAGH